MPQGIEWPVKISFFVLFFCFGFWIQKCFSDYTTLLCSELYFAVDVLSYILYKVAKNQS